MGSGKNFRQEKRMPTFYVMVTAVVFVAFCLIGAWVLSSPSESRTAEDAEAAAIDVKGKSASDNLTFEDGSGDITTENEEKVDKATHSRDKVEENTVNELDAQQQAQAEDHPEKKKGRPPKSKESEASEEEEIKDVDPDTNVKEEEEENDGGVVAKKEAEVEDSDGVESEPNKNDEEVVSKKEVDLEESDGAQSELQVENKESVTNSWKTQASESKEEVELEETKQTVADEEEELSSNDGMKKKKKKKPTVDELIVQTKGKGVSQETDWTLCDFAGATDYIPCLDNTNAIKSLHSTKHYEHRERHCPDTPPTCLVPLPHGYRVPIPWPQSRKEVWYSNVPHPGLVSYKKDQNWVKKSGERLLFPGGGTQFKHGASHYIDFIEQTLPDIAWGKHSRLILDVGCGVASFGGFIFDRDVLTMSFAPKDEHEAQVQLALERGIPAISAVMGTQRLVFPSNVFDIVHCARCRVPWHIEGGKLLLELNRVLRPGGYFVWSATPVYWTNEEDVAIWKEMKILTAAICWKLVAKALDSSTGIGVAIFQKPKTNSCYEKRKKQFPPMCDEDDRADAAWYVPMTACIHKLPLGESGRGTEWPEEWPLRLTTPPNWLSGQKGVYGKPAEADFRSDAEHWQRVVQKSYLRGLSIDWKNIRNVMDMRAVYGGFAAALTSQSVWVMNVVEFDSADTLPIIFDRGLFGLYHDWCESFSSYPRTYDLLHADHLFSRIQKRCRILNIVVEMDRLLRPKGWAIVRDRADIVDEVRALLDSLHWDIRMTFGKGEEALLVAQKTDWRPTASS